MKMTIRPMARPVRNFVTAGGAAPSATALSSIATIALDRAGRRNLLDPSGARLIGIR
jgi:hypothetical protein